MGLIKYTTSLLLIGLFAIALVTFAAQFAYDNDAVINIADDPQLSGINTSIRSDVQDFEISTGVSAEALANSSVSSDSESFEGGTVFKATPTSSLSMAKNAITAGFNKIFGSSDSAFGIIFTAFISLLGIIMIWYVYKAWAGRSPD
jgi:hypothetical protein